MNTQLQTLVDSLKTRQTHIGEAIKILEAMDKEMQSGIGIVQAEFSPAVATTTRRKHNLSEKGRRAISLAAKRRWRKVHEAQQQRTAAAS